MEKYEHIPQPPLMYNLYTILHLKKNDFSFANCLQDVLQVVLLSKHRWVTLHAY